MDIILYPLLELLSLIVNLFKWALIIYVILHLLMVFNFLDYRNRFIDSTYTLLNKIIEPFAKRIRKVVPVVGGFDLSILVLFLIVFYIQFLLGYVFNQYFYGKQVMNMLHAFS